MERCRRCCPHVGVRRADGVQRTVCCHCHRVLNTTVPKPRPKALYAMDATLDAFGRKPRTGSTR